MKRFFLGFLKGFFSGFIFHEYEIKGNIFRVYEVGLGKKKTTISIYEKKADVQVALIEMDTTIYNSLTEYRIWGVDDFSLEIATLWALYFDFVRFDYRRKQSNIVKETRYSYTMNMELKSKYNPMFKETLQEQNRI